MNGPAGHAAHPGEPAPFADGQQQVDEVDGLGEVVALHPDGALEVEQGGACRTVSAAELRDWVLAHLAGHAPMHVDYLAELLASADHRGLRAQVGPEQALAVYRQEVTDYRNVTGTAHTIVRFLTQAQPRERMALQEEASFVLGLRDALLEGGALHVDRRWLQGLEGLLHYLQASFPSDFADPTSGALPVIPVPNCFCLTCVASRYADGRVIGRVFTDSDRVLREANTGGLMIVPVKLAQYLRHAENCPQALVDVPVPCSCGLSCLLVAP